MNKTIPIEQAVQLALEQHKAGNLGRAEGLYVEILRQDPGNIDAMHLLGVLATQGGQPEAAIQLIQRAISRRGDVAIFHYNLAEAFVATRRFAEAIAAYERSIELDPDNIAARLNLSNVLVNTHQFAAAERVSRGGLELDADQPALLTNLRHIASEPTEAR